MNVQINSALKKKVNRFNPRFISARHEVMAAYNEGMGRNLNFFCTAPLTPAEAAIIMHEALRGETYNEFKADLLLRLPPSAEVYLAREYSVCIYVKGDIKAPRGFLHDERHVNQPKHEGQTRFWWD